MFYISSCKFRSFVDEKIDGSITFVYFMGVNADELKNVDFGSTLKYDIFCSMHRSGAQFSNVQFVTSFHGS